MRIVIFAIVYIKFIYITYVPGCWQFTINHTTRCWFIASLSLSIARSRFLRSNKSRDENLARLQSLRDNIAQGSNATSDQRITRMQSFRGNMAQARSDEETALILPRLK